MEVIDVITYNGEREILDLRLNILNEHVDRFIICEAKTTFTGKDKQLYFYKHEGYFRKFWRKITYYIIDEHYTLDEVVLAESSPNTQGAEHWKHEFLQKESIKKALLGTNDTATVFIGDVDEIWEPVVVTDPVKLKLRVYAYYLNNRSNEEFWGTFAARYKDIKNECLNHLRSNTKFRTEDFHGWHFTSMGGVEEVRRKLNASYTEESYNTAIVQKLLRERVQNGTDYLGRPFKFKKTEKEWPTYLAEHKEFYQSLLLP